MTIFLLFLLALCLCDLSVSPKSRFCPDYISRQNTMAVRGLFLFFVIARHFRDYVALNHPLDAPFLLLDRFLGQGIVSVFLFYSGYGVLESIQKKGAAYVRSMPVKRLLLTLLHFMTAVLLYLFAGILMGRSYAPKTVLLALVGWASVGSSNWYVFAILCLYLASWISFSLFRERTTAGVCSVFCLTVIYILVLHQFRPTESWWYNTALCYPAGMCFSLSKEKIQTYLWRRPKTYALCTLFCLAAVVALRPFTCRLFLYEVWSVLFAAAVVLVTMKLSLRNPLLRWMGERTFWIYILQRLPMMILRHIGVQSYPYLFLLLSLACIFPLAAVFDRAARYADGKLLKRLLS